MKRKCLAVCMAAAVCAVLLGTIRAEQIQMGLAEKVLRFHVLANSDSARDQQLKLRVRDAVGAMLAEKLRDANSLAESRAVVEDNLDEVERTAEDTVQKYGYDYPVSARLAVCAFPEKTYGGCTFPAGDYEALNVVIGAGGGHNWWCVMYPNLCFSGSMYAVDEQSGEALREVLTEEECEAVFRERDYRIRFKILGFMNNLLE